MKLSTYLLPVVLSLALLGAGCSVSQTVKVNANVAIENENINAVTAETITYDGQDGKTALELLQANHQVEVSDQGFVNAIDGVKPGNRQYWAFYVNSTLADTGAKDYKTKKGEKVEWKLESF